MKASVRRQFGMERRSDPVFLPDGHGLLLIGGQDLNPGSNLCDDGRADKDSGQRFLPKHDPDVVFEAVHLGTEGIAVDGDVQDFQAVLGRAFDLPGHEDHPHARPPDRHSRLHTFDDRVTEPKPLHELAHGGAFPPRDHEAVGGCKFFRSPHFANALDANAVKGVDVLFKIALDCDDTDDLTHCASLQGQVQGEGAE